MRMPRTDGLVLSRRIGEKIYLTTGAGERITITLEPPRAKQTRLRFEAPRSVDIVRAELVAGDYQNRVNCDAAGEAAQTGEASVSGTVKPSVA